MTEARENSTVVNHDHPNRRSILQAVAATGAVSAAGVGVAACGSENTSTPADSATSPAGDSASATVDSAKVAVGSGYIDKDSKVVVTQPVQGEYKAFTAICPHEQCLVGSVTNNVIECHCHGSQFSATDGAVKQGPATSGLAAKKVTREGSSIVVS